MSGEKSPFYYPVCSVHRSLQIKLTKGRLAREKTDFDLYRYMRVHRKKKCDSEEVVGIWGLHVTVPCGSAGKESACNMGKLGSIPGSGRPPGEGIGYPLQYFGLENSLDRVVYGVAKSRTRLSNLHFNCHVFIREEEEHLREDK